MTSRQYGRRMWYLHHKGNVPLVQRQSELVRCQSLVIEKLDHYWSQKAQERADKQARKRHTNL